MQRFVVAGLVSAICASAGTTQTAESLDDVLTEEQFLSVLDASHPLVRSSAESHDLSRVRAAEIARFDNPDLSVTREDPSGPVEQLDAVVSWKLPDTARGARIRAAEAEVEAHEYGFLAALAELRWRFRGAYANWALEVEREKQLQQVASRLEQLAVREQLRADQGESASLDAARIRLVVSDLNARRAQAAAASEEARSSVASWYPSSVEGARPVRPSVRDSDSRTDGPTVLAARADVEAARAERNAAGRFAASPELVLGWQRQETVDGSVDGPVVGLGWSIPLFKRNQGARAAAEIREVAAQARLETLAREQHERRQSLLRVRQSLEQALAVFEEQSRVEIPVLDAAEASFVAGESTTTDLLDTYQAHLEARLAQLDLYGLLLEATRDLERIGATGGFAVDVNPSTLEYPTQ